jgi:hypothetical protein
VSPDAIRDAVASGEYAKAARLFDEYARALPTNRAALDELQQLLGWTRLTVLCARAHGYARVQALRDELNVIDAYGR